MRIVRRLSALAAVLCLAASWGTQASAQDDEVIIKREALQLHDARSYRVTLELVPARSVELTAAADGIVRSISVKPGQKVAKEVEAARLDDTRASLVLKRAKALLQAARLARKSAKADSDAAALAEAQVEAAQADLDLAQFDVERQMLRTPFAGEVHRVFVSEGQFVRAGDRLATVADVSQLTCELPVDRTQVKAGSTIEIKIDDQPVKAKVDGIVPLPSRLEVLRELSDSIGCAIVQIDNASGKYTAGQTVYCDLVPLDPVAFVPTTAVINQTDGSRRVNVLRENVVRALPVRVLGKIGTERAFVTGMFAQGDELIVSSSKELGDGTPVKPLLVSKGTPAAAPANPAAGAATKAAAPAAGPKTNGPVGF